MQGPTAAAFYTAMTLHLSYSLARLGLLKITFEQLILLMSITDGLQLTKFSQKNDRYIHKSENSDPPNMNTCRMLKLNKQNNSVKV